MDVIFDVAKSIVNTKNEDIPREAIEIAKKFIIDSIGVSLAGPRVPGNAEIIDLLRSGEVKRKVP